jgi:hypothetical protein
MKWHGDKWLSTNEASYWLSRTLRERYWSTWQYQVHRLLPFLGPAAPSLNALRDPTVNSSNISHTILQWMQTTLLHLPSKNKVPHDISTLMKELEFTLKSGWDGFKGYNIPQVRIQWQSSEGHSESQLQETGPHWDASVFAEGPTHF